ncbi:MAG: hypothetical protein HWN68_19725 [Desulfobacterales bacterium]|nr:hypothetical protein [Desulfobacterales bacterium]
MSEEIKLGYEIGTSNIMKVKPSHLIATGITQLSGKTTTLEALIKRSGLKAIVFKTKVGETGFTEGTVIAPYFKERSDWQYVSSLLEATLKEKLKFERAWIINVCKNASSLLEVKANIDKKLAEGKLSQLSRNIYTTLQAYFDLVLPQLQYANFSRTLTLHNGINIMDLERYSEEIQKRTNISEIMEKCLFLNPSSGSRSRITKKIAVLTTFEFVRKDRGHIHGNLKQRIAKLLEIHNGSSQEIESVYNHVLMELLP